MSSRAPFLCRAGVRLRQGRWKVIGAILLAVSLVLATDPYSARGGALTIPTSIRVRLTVTGDHLRLAPASSAMAVIDGSSTHLNPHEAIILGHEVWFLTLPASASPFWIPELTIEGPAVDRHPTHALLGPYLEPSKSERHRRLIRAETNLGIGLRGPRPAMVAGQWATYTLPTHIEIRPEDPHAITRVNGVPYRGTIKVERVGRSFEVINDVVLADYLASVIGAEMPLTWELEALKAQAVAARTYVIQQLQPDEDYDLCDNQNCQAYGGVSTESVETHAAAEKTQGVVALYNGAPIQALYSANAGDITENSEHVWGTAVPYLRSVDSSADAAAMSVAWGASGYRWTRVISLHELGSYRSIRERNIGSVIEVRILERTAAGRPLRIVVVGTTGEVELFGDQIRTSLGLPSAFIELRRVQPSSITLISPSQLRLKTFDDDGYMLTSLRRSISFNSAPPDVDLVNGAVHVAKFTRPGSVVISGRGFGHGLGMSQWGAQGMALEGKTYDEILLHYYTGIELHKLS